MKILNGLRDLLTSLSGTFALISLACITLVTYKQPTVGAGAFIAFFPIVCALLTLAEHRETMAQIVKEVKQDVVANLPNKGQI